MNGMIQQKEIDVAGVLIAQDDAGRFCLNDLHKAAGGEARHQPAQFMRLASTDELVAELSGEQGDMGNPISVVRGGTAQGTYVCKELVYAYAMWISPRFSLQVIRTFDAVATGQQPAPKQIGTVEASKTFRALFGIGRLIGLGKNAAAISANHGTAATTGTNMLALIGQTHLVNEQQAICFTPTELGHRLCISARAFNTRLAERGMQESINGHWVPTDKGMQHAVILDTGKSHGSGTPIQQVKWRDSVLEEVAL
jgi:hypothetical protein